MTTLISKEIVQDMCWIV